MVPSKLRGVTALYDIKRASEGDGRTVDQYIAWLNRSIQLPIPFTVYLDPAIARDKIALKPGDEIISLPWDDLIAARWLPQVGEICTHRERFLCKDDLTYRVPKYIITTMSKLEFLEREASRTDATHLLWVDAGSARFTRYDLAELELKDGITERLSADADLVVYTSHHLRDYYLGRPHPPFPGRCEGLIRATVFLVRADAASRVRKAVYDHVEQDWLPNGLWDTEQTAIGETILAGKIRTAIQEENGRHIRLLGAMFRRPKVSWLGLRWDTRNHYNSPPATVEAALAFREWARTRVRLLRYPPHSSDVAAIIPEAQHRGAT